MDQAQECAHFSGKRFSASFYVLLILYLWEEEYKYFSLEPLHVFHQVLFVLHSVLSWILYIHYYLFICLFIYLYFLLQSLDEVQVEMETCTDLRSQTSSSVLPSYSSGGRYGFADKVIDGMTVTVNSVLITFCSPAFHASFQVFNNCCLASA